ncbi:MAG: translation initiation factor IF-2, partial [Proteobacteria bacterium]|nr:translation initiation factor IF-2 [Pseudomonadota bacterium]
RRPVEEKVVAPPEKEEIPVAEKKEAVEIAEVKEKLERIEKPAKEIPAKKGEKELPAGIPEVTAKKAEKGLKIAKEITVPEVKEPLEEVKEKPSKKRKKPVEVVIEEKPARKKTFVKQFIGKKKAKRRGKKREERPAGWREGKKAAVIEMKKTEVTTPKAIKRRIKVADAIRVGDLAKRMGVKASDIISKLISLGLMATINQAIDCDTATLIASDFGYQVEPVVDEYEESIKMADSSPRNLKPRAPVVTIMGHVDHGKTSLLDAIRETNVIDVEAGGITQAIGAYHVDIKGRDIVFLDTPGHEAFTAMRARGAQVTDVVVLVVAADDGVKEQTVEAINHSRVAGVPIIVAINKIDKPGANLERVKQELSDHDLVPEEWGGSTIFSEISAKKKVGIEDLLELILLQADIMELKADPDRPASGIVIEAKLDRGRGPVATVLIQDGTLKEGDAFVSRTEYGRVRAMVNDKGQRIKAAGPSMPVEVIGFSNVPQASTDFVCVEDEKKARSMGEYRLIKEREKELSASSKITLEQLYERIKEGVKELNVIIKGDVHGSVEALSEALVKLSTKDIKLKIIHSSTGAITEVDVMLASASDAIIIGFNVRPDARVSETAEQEGVDIELYDVIYDAIADVKAAMEGLLEPIYKEVVQGRVEVRQLFKAPKVGVIAGSYVTDGKVARSSNIKVVRDGVVVYDGKILSLKRFKDDASEVASGFECGIAVEGFNDIKVGDTLEAYIKEQVARKLE